MPSTVTESQQGSIAIVTLNRPEALNALSQELRRTLHDTIVRLDADAEIRAIVLTGEGDRAFSAGVDLKEMGVVGLSLSLPEDDPVRAIEACKKPVIGAINGVAITGGFELALSCDILIASSRARFADTHIRVGVIPGWGLSQKLSRLIGIYRAKELSFTGNFIDAALAYEWGLVNRVVAPEDLLPTALKLANDIVGLDPDFVTQYKRLIDEGFGIGYDASRKLEIERSIAATKTLSPAEIERRRAGILSRGKSQLGVE